MEYFEVYLHILKAKDIKGVEKNGNSDPYIRVMVPKAKGKLQELYKTETIKNTRNPEYYLELLIRVPCNVESIVLQLRDWNAILKHKKLGVVVLPLSKFPNKPNLELHAIEEGGGVLQLCTRLLGTIAGMPEPTPVEVMPKVRLHLEHMIYHPGEVVRGHVIVSDRGVNNENQHVFLRPFSYLNSIQYMRYFQCFKCIEKAPCVWAFQFLIPKRIPTVHYVSRPGELDLSISADVKGGKAMKVETKIIIMPPFEGLEPQLSPRRREQHMVAPHSLLVTWVNLPKILYREQTNRLKFNLSNSTVEPIEFTHLCVYWKQQRITTSFNPNTNAGLVSEEYFPSHSRLLQHNEIIKLEPSETREFTLNEMDSTDWTTELSAPFEITGDVHELNHFFEVEIQPSPENAVVINRTPFFWTSESFTRQAPPNYQLSMDPDTFWVTTLKDPDVIYPLMAPSAAQPKIIDINFYLSEPIPSEMFSPSRLETLETLSINEELPPLTNIFDVPFEDAC